MCYPDNIRMKDQSPIIVNKKPRQIAEPMESKLYEFQKVGVDFLVKKSRSLLADDMGLGKTVMALMAAKRMNHNRVLIVCPKTVMHVWERHIEDWLPHCTYIAVTGVESDRSLKILADRNFIICHYKQLRVCTEALFHKPFSGFILDESHHLKNRKAKVVSQMAMLVRRNPTAFLFALTGTPILNKPEEIWTLLNMFDHVRFDSFWRWAQEHMHVLHKPIPGNRNWARQIGSPRNLKKLKAQIGEFMLRRSKSNTIDLPPVTHEHIEIEMEGAQLYRYRTMEDQFYADLGGNREVAAPIVIAQMIRLKQLAIAAEVIDVEANYLEGNKADAVVELIHDAGEQKQLIFTQFAVVANLLSRRLTREGLRHMVITGSLTTNKRIAIADEFQHGSCPTLIMTTQLGTGITLTAATIVIMIDKLWTPGYNQQAMDRVHRIGQDKPVTIYHLASIDSIDSYIEKILVSKRSMIDVTINTQEVVDAVRKGELIR